MQMPHYLINANTDRSIYRFDSIGKKGTIKKIVSFALLPNYENVYNLAMGDYVDDKINYGNITDNKDLEKVFITVAQTVIEFLETHPNAMVYVEGDEPRKTRLYRINISVNIELIKQDYEVLGLLETGLEEYKPNADYIAFLISKK